MRGPDRSPESGADAEADEVRGLITGPHLKTGMEIQQLVAAEEPEIPEMIERLGMCAQPNHEVCSVRPTRRIIHLDADLRSPLRCHLGRQRPLECRALINVRVAERHGE